MPGETLSLGELVDLVREGHFEFLPQLRDALRSHPDALRALGDLSQIAETMWLELISKKDVVQREALRLYLADFKAELTESTSDPLERLLVDELGTWWLQSRHADMVASGNGIAPLKVISGRVRLQESAHRSYMRAIQQLVLLRKSQSREVGKAQPRTAARRPAAQAPADAVPMSDGGKPAQPPGDPGDAAFKAPATTADGADGRLGSGPAAGSSPRSAEALMETDSRRPYAES